MHGTPRLARLRDKPRTAWPLLLFHKAAYAPTGAAVTHEFLGIYGILC
jgi:hypothetical protein